MLSRRWLINYALILLIGLIVFIGFKGDDLSESAQANRILDLEVSNINRLEILTANAHFVLSQQQDGWMLEQPVRWPAYQFNVDHLLQIANAGTDAQFPADGKDLASFGLQNPYALLILNETRIAFGISHSIGERRYALVDDTIVLLADVYYPFIQQGLAALVDRRLVPPMLDLQSLGFADLQLERDGEQGWRAADNRAISPEWIQQRVQHWQELEASRLSLLNAAREPLQRVEAQFNNGSDLGFSVLSTTPEITIANPDLGLLFHFPEGQYQQLLSTPDDNAS